MIVAGIDCGTNSIRLLIADIDKDGRVTQEFHRDMQIVRLGQDVDKNGYFVPEAVERTLTAVDDYARLCTTYGVESVRFAATSATRDASNRDIFLEGVHARMGIYPQVLSGEEEAQTSFAGAIFARQLYDAPVTDAARNSSTNAVENANNTKPCDPAQSTTNHSDAETILVIDVGGGSTELVLGTDQGQVLQAFSMNVGSVRMKERHFRNDPPLLEEICSARKDIHRALDEAEAHVDIGRAQHIIGVAGTVTSVTAAHLNLETYDSSRVHGTAMSIADITAQCEWYIAATAEERAALGFMHPGRVPVIGAGALVWETVVERIVQRCAERGTKISHVTTSEYDILDGLALWAAREPQPWKPMI
ncbi:exopolyphosphatase [Actinotignum urinale]|uniref:Ppx/GppA phosphatase family protein n=1 Tax=Actinotignum urinale TaxID=190146 RepID=UPI002A826AE2|nr:exopolyphosphatase [Actinotignum urinale]MDY5151900.1 exopolyphosphatase [Actinotignum urinale]